MVVSRPLRTKTPFYTRATPPPEEGVSLGKPELSAYTRRFLTRQGFCLSGTGPIH